MKLASSALGMAAALAASVCLPAPAIAQQQATVEARSPIRVFIDIEALATAHGTPVTRQQRAAQASQVAAITAKRKQLTAISEKLADEAATLPASEVTSLQADAARLGDEIRQDTAQLSHEARIQQTEQLSLVGKEIEAAVHAYLDANPAIGVVETLTDDRSLVIVSDRYTITPAISAMLEAGDNAAAPQGPQQPPVVRYAAYELVAYESGAIDALQSQLDTINDEAANEQARLNGEIRQLLESITPTTSADETQRRSGIIQSLEAQTRTSAEQYTRLLSQTQAEFWANFHTELTAFVRTAPAFAYIDEIELIGLPGEAAPRGLIFGDDRFSITDELAAAYKRKLSE